jgi:hypothetical protein
VRLLTTQANRQGASAAGCSSSRVQQQQQPEHVLLVGELEEYRRTGTAAAAAGCSGRGSSSSLSSLCAQLIVRTEDYTKASGLRGGPAGRRGLTGQQERHQQQPL